MRRSQLIAGLAAAALSAAASAPAAAAFDEPGNNFNGDILISDQFNNRVVEVNRHHRIVWSFGNGSNVAGPRSIVGVNDVERVGENTLIAGTGAPQTAPTEPACEAKVGGCPDNRVILVNPEQRIVWQYGKAGVTGSGYNELNTPVFAAGLSDELLRNGHILIADENNDRVIEVNRAKESCGNTANPAPRQSSKVPPSRVGCRTATR
jgi:hypothetical protein